jgi:hypothetical protein
LSGPLAPVQVAADHLLDPMRAALAATAGLSDDPLVAADRAEVAARAAVLALREPAGLVAAQMRGLTRCCRESHSPACLSFPPGGSPCKVERPAGH